MLEQTFLSIAFRFPRKEIKRGATIACIPKESRTDDKHNIFIVAPEQRDPIQNMTNGAWQADTAHIMAPAEGSFTTESTIDNHRAGEIQGQRLDSSSRLINLGSAADPNQQLYRRKQTRATESTLRRHLADSQVDSTWWRFSAATFTCPTKEDDAILTSAMFDCHMNPETPKAEILTWRGVGRSCGIRTQARSILPHWWRPSHREREHNALPEAPAACQLRAALQGGGCSRAMRAQRRDSAVPASET